MNAEIKEAIERINKSVASFPHLKIEGVTLGEAYQEVLFLHGRVKGILQGIDDFNRAVIRHDVAERKAANV